MSNQHWTAESGEDDQNFLATLLTTPGQATAAPSRRLRRVTLRSKENLRRQALSGYRFRTGLDSALAVAERVLGLVVVGFFIWWLYDGYGRDLLHSMREQPRPTVDLQIAQPGMSAAELSERLGDRLPSSDLEQGGAAPKPDYLIPNNAFVLPPGPTRTSIPFDPRPVRLLVPTMGLDSPVREVYLHDGIWEVADYAVGYHHGTAMPGNGNTVLAGHAGLRGAVFANLYLLQPGHDIYLDTAGRRYHYVVRSTTSVWPQQVEVMHPTVEPIITLITCTAWDTQRLIVVADLVDTAPLAPAEAAGSQPTGEGS